LLLLLNPLGQKLQILDGARDLALGGIELVFIHQRSRAPETPAGPVGDGDDHRQIAQQFIGRRCGLRLELLVRFEKQLRIFEDALPDLGRGVAPCGVEFAGLPAREVMRHKRIRQASAILNVDARHRNQILHGDMSGDLAHADSLLNRLGKHFDQGQSAGYPTDAAVKPAR